MSKMVVDSSTLISCGMNCLLWVFDEFRYTGTEFLVPKEVEKEVIDRGLRTKKYRFEAIRVAHHFVNETLKTSKKDLSKQTNKLLNLANSSFYIKNNPLKILEKADAEVAALAIKEKADAILTDERTLRLLIEDPDAMEKMLEHRMHKNVRVDKRKLYSFQKEVGKIRVLRSVDLLAAALTDKIFEPTFQRCKKIGISEKDIISGILFALKFSGCSVSFREVNDLTNLVLRDKK